MPSWILVNVEEIQKDAPYTFYRPSDNIIDQLKPDQAIVKLMFQFESDDPDAPSGERMWVIIESISEDGTYTGRLDNEPFYIKDIKAGDKVIFRREHIMQYDTLDDLEIEDENAESIEPYFKRCIVSNQIMKDKLPVVYIYKEEPSEDKDSGWHFMSGKETDEYLEDHNNLQYIAIGVLLNKDDSFIHLLNAPVGSAFARDGATGVFLETT